MNTDEIIKSYTDLLIKQYRGKPKAVATVGSWIAPILMPQFTPSGKNWGVSSTTPSANWAALAYSPTLKRWTAVARGGETMYSDDDGTTWTSGTNAGIPFTSVCWGKGQFVGVADGGFLFRVATSPDGINWTQQVAAADRTWSSVCSDGTQFVSVSQDDPITASSVMTSPDAINWTLQTIPLEAMSRNWSAVKSGNGMFVAVAKTGTGFRAMSSPDAITWTLRATPADNQWQGLTFGNNLFVAVAFSGSGDRVMTSPDGFVWTIQATPADLYWISVDFGNGVFTAASSSGTDDSIMTSPDAVNWSMSVCPITDNLAAVAFGGGSFISVTSNGTNQIIMNPPDWNDLPILPLAVRDGFNIDTAVGVQLDLIGKYIGIKRSGFNFSGAVVLEDTDYRKLLKAVSKRNALHADLKSIQAFIAENFSDALEVFDFGNMNMRWFYKLANGVNEVAEFFIKAGLLPRPLGVYSDFIYTLDYFGFLEDDKAGTFGDLADPTVGSPFVSGYANPNRKPEYGITVGYPTDFGFLEDPDAGTFGDLNDATVGAPFARLI